MKKIILLLLLYSSISAFAQKTNYSGTWSIDKSKTDFAGAHAAEYVVPQTLKIDQQKEKLLLTRINVDAQDDEQPPILETLTFDGKPFERLTPGVKVITTLRWLNDHELTISRKGVTTATETWTLEDGGKTLVIDRSVEQSDGGKYTLKCFYDKQ